MNRRLPIVTVVVALISGMSVLTTVQAGPLSDRIAVLEKKTKAQAAQIDLLRKRLAVVEKQQRQPPATASKPAEPPKAAVAATTTSADQAPPPRPSLPAATGDGYPPQGYSYP